VPYSNVINGGEHAPNYLMFQEFMIVPQAKTMQERVRIISEFYHTLKKLIVEKYGAMSASVGDEGGFAPNLSKSTQALDLLMKAIDEADYSGSVGIALDAAASDFYNAKTKIYEVEEGIKLNYKELTSYYNDLIKNIQSFL